MIAGLGAGLSVRVIFLSCSAAPLSTGEKKKSFVLCAVGCITLAFIIGCNGK